MRGRSAYLAPAIAIWAFAVLLGGCALFDPPDSDLPALPETTGPYTLGPGDTLHIVVFDQTTLSGAYLVGDDGGVTLPLAGRIPAAGETVSAFASDLAARLKQRQILNDPAVSAEITIYRPFYILGEVNHPGAYPYRPGMSVLSAVSLAGGFTDRALQSYVEVTRGKGSKSASYRAPPEGQPEPGDVITVLERRF